MIDPERPDDEIEIIDRMQIASGDRVWTEQEIGDWLAPLFQQPDPRFPQLPRAARTRSKLPKPLTEIEIWNTAVEAKRKLTKESK